MNWIATKDRMPRVTGNYLINDNKKITIAFWSDLSDWEVERNDRLIGFYETTITFWMPLPKIPTISK